MSDTATAGPALTDDSVGTFTITGAIGGDLTVRRLGFGAMRISGARNADGARDRDEARRIVRRVVARGVNFIDTANIYGYGESEEIMLPIPGTSQVAHADSNVDAAWVALDDSDIARIDTAAGA